MCALFDLIIGESCALHLFGSPRNRKEIEPQISVVALCRTNTNPNARSDPAVPRKPYCLPVSVALERMVAMETPRCASCQLVADT